MWVEVRVPGSVSKRHLEAPINSISVRGGDPDVDQFWGGAIANNARESRRRRRRGCQVSTGLCWSGSIEPGVIDSAE